jgi:hypothetical protein
MSGSDSTTAVHELPPAGLALYRDAFARYKTHALWNMRLLEDPTSEDALAVARRLRVEGDMPARFLAEEIERTCRAAL